MGAVALRRAQSVVCVYKRDKKSSISGEQGIWVMSGSNEGKQTHEIKFGCRQSSQKRSQLNSTSQSRSLYAGEHTDFLVFERHVTLDKHQCSPSNRIHFSNPQCFFRQKLQEMPCPSPAAGVRGCKELIFPLLPHQKHEIEFPLSGQSNVLNMCFPAGECLLLVFFSGSPLVTKKNIETLAVSKLKIYVLNGKVKPEFPFFRWNVTKISIEFRK